MRAALSPETINLMGGTRPGMSRIGTMVVPDEKREASK